MAKAFKHNPRRITVGEAEDLRRDLAELGDLGGIVHNVASTEADMDDAIVGGHQRLSVMFGQDVGGKFKLSDAEIEIVTRYDAPDEQGTIAHGFLLWHGKRYAYRQVQWDANTFRRANIAANARGGHWDADILSGWDGNILLDFFDADMMAGTKGDIAIISSLLASEQSDHARPDFTELIEQFSGGGQKKDQRDGNWLYIEYYGDDERYERIKGLLGDKISKNSGHEVDKDFFELLVNSYVNSSP